MNIFAVSLDPKEAAQMLCDQHVKKMPIESAQLLCSGIHIVTNGDIKCPYLPYQPNHRCAKWCRATSENWRWLIEHSFSLLEEYTLRYKSVMMCPGSRIASIKTMWEVITFCASYSTLIPKGNLTPHALAMPSEHWSSDTVEAYRNYYIDCKFEFRSGELSKWERGRKPPYWWPYVD